MSTKRVILATGSRLLREALQRVIDEAERLEVVEELSDSQRLGPAIDRFDPAWVILTSPPAPGPAWIDSWLLRYPSVRFIVLSPDYSSIRARSPDSYEEDLTQLSLRGFIDVLERDLRQI